jgi:hypothetical protein
MDSDQHHLLRRYLTDHWAAAGGGISLIRRIAHENGDTQWADELQRIADQIVEDDATLAHIRTTLGITRGRVRRSTAVVAERVARLKLNGRLLHYSPLSRVEEAEAMISAVMAKQRLWATLERRSGLRIAGVDFAGLIARADGQLTTLESFHQWAAEQAFGTSVATSSGLSAR